MPFIFLTIKKLRHKYAFALRNWLFLTHGIALYSWRYVSWAVFAEGGDPYIG